LGAARGQRLRKGPCASYPTRHFFSASLSITDQSAVKEGLNQALFSFASMGMRLAIQGCREWLFFYKMLSNEQLKNSRGGTI